MRDRGGAESASERAQPEPIRYHDTSTLASDPLPVQVDQQRLRKFCPNSLAGPATKPTISV
jgi:hypothetical protein